MGKITVTRLADDRILLSIGKCKHYLIYDDARLLVSWLFSAVMDICTSRRFMQFEKNYKMASSEYSERPVSFKTFMESPKYLGTRKNKNGKK